MRQSRNIVLVETALREGCARNVTVKPRHVTPYCLHRRVCSPDRTAVTTTSANDGRGEASREGRGWCALLYLQDAQANACQGRLGQQCRHLPAQGCRVGRREGGQPRCRRSGAGSQPSEIRGHRCRSSFNTVFGKAMREKAPLAKGTPVRVPQMLSLTK